MTRWVINDRCIQYPAEYPTSVKSTAMISGGFEGNLL